MSMDPQKHHCLSKAEARGNAGCLLENGGALGTYSRASRELGHGCEHCTPVVHTCMAGGTSPGILGLPDTATRDRDSASASAGVPGHTQHCKVGKMVEIQISTKYNMN